MRLLVYLSNLKTENGEWKTENQRKENWRIEVNATLYL